MRQRVVIALALCADPALVIADEPTTALDVSVQAHILQLLRDLHRESRVGMLLITHDLGVIAKMADRVAVFYAGRVAEISPVAELFHSPRHPYTRGLINATPMPAEDGAIRLDQISARCPALAQSRPAAPSIHAASRQRRTCRVTVPSLLDDGAATYSCFHPAGKAGCAMNASEFLIIDRVSKVYRRQRGLFERLQKGFRAKTALKAVRAKSASPSIAARPWGLSAKAAAGNRRWRDLSRALMPPTQGRIDFRSAGGPKPRLQMIFQDPYSSLNGCWKIADTSSPNLSSCINLGPDAAPSGRASMSSCNRSGFRAATPKDTRRNAQVARGSASQSPAPWPESRNSSFWTN